MEKMSEIRYGGGGVPYVGPNAEPKEEVVEEKQPEPEATATVTVTETETEAEEVSELEIEK